MFRDTRSRTVVMNDRTQDAKHILFDREERILQGHGQKNSFSFNTPLNNKTTDQTLQYNEEFHVNNTNKCKQFQ